MTTKQTKGETMEGTYSLVGVSPRGDKRHVKFEVSSEAYVAVAEFELSPVSGWIRVSRTEICRAPIARRWYREFLARGYEAPR